MQDEVRSEYMGQHMLNDFREMGLVQRFLYPSLWLFLVPVASLVFFEYATHKHDSMFMGGVRKMVKETKSLSDREKHDISAYYVSHPVSAMLASSDPEDQELVANIPDQIKTRYAYFRWFGRLALVSIVAGVLLYPCGWLAVGYSTRSPRAQYWSLLAGWHAIRAFLTVQVLAQGVLLIGLSYWVTAVLFQVYIARLIILVVLVVLAAVGSICLAILTPLSNELELSNVVLLGRNSSPRLWEKLDSLAARVGTAPPDRVILGVDTNFFVTQSPLRINGKYYVGRSLYMSLSLVKTMTEEESSAVLAHELAHFSGHDTYYSVKTAPLLQQFNHYLAALAEGAFTRPLFDCAALFRTMYEYSLKKVSREREFRADRIAAEHISPGAMAHSLLRIATYGVYRSQVQQELLRAEKKHDELKILQRIEAGYYLNTGWMIDQYSLMTVQTAHPFDSHPPLAQRLEALHYAFEPAVAKEILAQPGDGHWFGLIDQAEAIEKKGWEKYESHFNKAHELQLAFQYIPETDEERAIVARHFPAVVLEGYKKQQVAMDHESIVNDSWGRALKLADILGMQMNQEWGVPVLVISDTQGLVKLKLPKEKEEYQALVQQIHYYTSRAHHAREFQATKKAQAQ